MAQRAPERNTKLPEFNCAADSELAYLDAMRVGRVAWSAFCGLCAWAFATSGVACGGKAVVESSETAAGTGGDGAGGDNYNWDAGGPDDPPSVPPQCNCPDAPGYAPCVKPLECCPVVGQCEDPAHFNCTGSSKTCP